MKNSFLKTSWQTLKDKKLLWIFSPLSIVYSIITTLRSSCYKFGLFKTYSPEVPTVCIGNISVGGNGKTPLTQYIAEELSKNEKKVSILTRGYSGLDFSKPHLASTADNTSTIGDEAMIYKSKLANSAIAISKNRPAGAELLANLNTEIILMDDGFQHFAIKPDLSLCLIDVSDLQHYKNSSLTSTMPAGIFRELPSIGIRRADRVVFIKRSTITDADLEEINKIRDQYSIEEYSLIEIQANQIKDGFTKQATVPLGKSIVTFSSIAKPQTFHENLKAMGYQITNSHIFEDHHKFTESDFRKICRNHKSPIVCTYKDLVKVENWISQESTIYYLEQKVVDVSDGNFNIVSYLENQIELKRATG